MGMPRTVVASLIAPVALLLPIVGLAIWEISNPMKIINSDLNDAPLRAFGVFVITLPIIYVLLALLSHVVGMALLRFKIVSLLKFVGTSATLAGFLGVPVGLVLGSPRQFGPLDLLTTMAVIIGLFVFCALPGSMCWWYFAARHRP
jgi:hypothetical protein